MYRKWLSTFICCGWAYGCTLTLLYLCRWGQILESCGKVEPKWHCGVIVEAVNYHWLHPISILNNVYKVIEHLHMLWVGIWMHPYTVIPVQVGAKIWEIRIRLSRNDVVVSWLRMWATTDCISHPYWMYIKCLSNFICCGWAYGCTITLLYLCRWELNFGKLG